MRYFLLTLFLALFTLNVFCQVRVRGYYRSNGTYVRPHMRSSPDGNPYNNYSYPGNTNPYTGRVATGDPDTYLKRYGSSGTYAKQPSVETESERLNRLYSPPPRVAPNPYARAGETVIIQEDSPLRPLPEHSSAVKVLVSGNYKILREEGTYYEVEGPGGKGYVSKIYVQDQPDYEDINAASTTPTVRKSFTKYLDSLNKVVWVCLYSPVLQKPDARSATITNADARKAVLVADHNSVYCIVQIGKSRGYLNKKYLYYY